jgi:hypothetical protein
MLQVLDPANQQRRLIPLRKQKCEVSSQYSGADPSSCGFLTFF